MTVTWYYMEEYAQYFECVGSTSSHYILVGLPGFEDEAIPIVKWRCRQASYDEVREHANQVH